MCADIKTLQYFLNPMRVLPNGSASEEALLTEQAGGFPLIFLESRSCHSTVCMYVCI